MKVKLKNLPAEVDPVFIKRALEWVSCEARVGNPNFRCTLDEPCAPHQAAAALQQMAWHEGLVQVDPAERGTIGDESAEYFGKVSG